MHVFDAECKIRKINSPEEIIYRFYQIRKQHFIKRKDYLIKTLKSDLEVLDSKIKFIKLVIEEEGEGEGEGEEVQKPIPIPKKKKQVLKILEDL